MRILIKRSIFVVVLGFIFSGIISCEKDFTDIGSSIINNSEFDTKDTILEVEITQVPIETVRADGLVLPGGILGEYLLGVYNNQNFKQIEASIVSQLSLPTSLDVANETDSTSVHTELDTVIFKIPYNATLVSGTTSEYTLDSIIGNREVPFNLNIYETTTYLNILDPADPTKINSYQSNATYAKKGDPLNATLNYQFVPNANDTVLFVDRTLKSGQKFRDTINFSTSSNIPFARIPLKKAKFLEFMSLYEGNQFSSQDEFNNYFRGIILEASGNDGSLLSLSFSNNLAPSVELYYTNTVTLNSSGAVIDTILKNDSFTFGGISNSIYKMGPSQGTSATQVAIQGTVGSMANVKIFKDGLAELRSKNWLINDASLTFFVDKDLTPSDTINTPFRLYLYKNGVHSDNTPNPSVITDVLTEGFSSFSGFRQLDTEKKPDNYNFKITDYVSNLLSGESSYNPVLGLKVFNRSDIPSSTIDTIVKTYNWNPRAVMLLNELPANGSRRAQLKISYSEKKD